MPFMKRVSDTNGPHSSLLALIKSGFPIGTSISVLYVPDGSTVILFSVPSKIELPSKLDPMKVVRGNFVGVKIGVLDGSDDSTKGI